MGKKPKKDVEKPVEKENTPKRTEANTEKEKGKRRSETKKEYVEIVGDSMINGIEERGLAKNKRVKVRKHPGATSEDIIDHLKPVIRKKPSKIIIHAGTNDIKNGTNYLHNVKQITKMIKSELPKTKICFSGIVRRYDMIDGEKHVDEVNRRLLNYCKQEELDFLPNDNIGKNDLGKKLLHPNKRFELTC